MEQKIEEMDCLLRDHQAYLGRVIPMMVARMTAAGRTNEHIERMIADVSSEPVGVRIRRALSLAASNGQKNDD